MKAKLDRLILLIPDYNPHDTAEDCIFDYEQAQKAIDFFPRFLCLSKNCAKKDQGAPFQLEPWQKGIIGNIFGWKRPDGTRRYREVFCLIPRKNGKSELLSGLINYIGYCDGEKGGEIYSAAADREQATLVFSSAKTMIENNAKLSSRAEIYKKAIIYPHHTTYRSLSAESYSKHGLNASLICIDELHAIQDRDLVDVLTTSIGARRQPLVIYITTADFSRPETIYSEIYKRSKLAREAKTVSDVGYNPYFLPVMYEATHEDDWTSPDVWKKCNPNLDVSVTLDYLQQECRKAQDNPSYENVFKRLHLDLSTEADTRWISSNDWNLCKGTPFDLNQLIGEVCEASLDLASTTDLACVMLYFPKFKVLLPHFFAPRDNAEQRERVDRVPYLTWQKQGYMTLTDGNVIDYDFIKAHILKLAETYKINSCAYDGWNATQIALQLAEKGINMVEFKQGYMSMNEPSKEFERLIMKHDIRHLDNPILNWCAANVAIETNAEGSIKPSKAKSNERIDGIVCAVMCVGRNILTEQATAPQIFKL